VLALAACAFAALSVITLPGTAEEHEARERFTLDGKSIFGPHHSIEALLALADEVETRTPQEAAP